MVDISEGISSNEDEGLQVRLAVAKAKGLLCAKQEERDFEIRQHITSAYAARHMLEILKRLPSHKLNFLGLSYGIMVGQKFASMYPEHVSRIVLNGTIDGKYWTYKWRMQHLIDVDAICTTFHHNCFEAKDACLLWRDSDSDSTAIETRIEKFLGQIEGQTSSLFLPTT